MRPAGERGLFPVQSPSCLSLCLPLTLRLPDPLCPAKPLLAVSPALSLGFSLCSALASSPTTCFALLTPSLLYPLCCHLFCFEGGEVQRRSWVCALPLSFGTGAGQDCICSHFCAELKSPCRRTSFCTLTVLQDASAPSELL